MMVSLEVVTVWVICVVTTVVLSSWLVVADELPVTPLAVEDKLSPEGTDDVPEEL